MNLIKSAHLRALLILVAVGLTLNLSTLNNEYLLDDFQFLTSSNYLDFPTFSSFFTKTYSQHYSPLYYLVNVTLFDLFKTQSHILHGFSLGLLGLNIVLLYTFVWKLTQDKGWAFISTLIFCVHPINYFAINQIAANFVLISSASILASCVFFFNAQSSTLR